MNRTDLYKLVSEILEFPYDKHKYKFKNYPQRIVNAIFKTIADAIKRGEVVDIPGLGKFRMVWCSAKKAAKLHYLPQFGDKEVKVVPYIQPAHNSIRFYPDKSIYAD